MKINLTTRDFINIGIFTVIYFLIMFSTGLLGMGGPLLVFVGWGLSVLFNGIVVIFLLARSPKMGVLTLLGLFVGLIFTLTGHPIYMLLGFVVLGLIADLIASDFGRAEELKPQRGILAYAILSLAYATNFIPFFYNSDAYIAGIADQMGQDYATRMGELFQPGIIVGFTVFAFVLSLFGGWLGVKVGKKHFQKAGLTH